MTCPALPFRSVNGHVLSAVLSDRPGQLEHRREVDDTLVSIVTNAALLS